MVKYFLGGVVSVLLFTGCVNQQPTNSTTVTKQPVKAEPKWLDDPYIDGDKVAAIGCARYHFKGESEQKKLAISRAKDQIASQINTKISNMTHRTKKIKNNASVSSSVNSSSLHEVEEVTISTKVKATYKKPTGEICVWVVQK